MNDVLEPEIDLVAVAYKAPDETQKFLESLRHVSVPFSLTVVDNSPENTPGVTRVLQEMIPVVSHMAMCTSTHLVSPGENLGYARAINLGSQIGTAPFLAALNCDILFEPPEDVVAQTLSHFLSNPDVGIIGPRTTDSFDRFTHAGIVTQPNGRDEHRLWMHLDLGQCNDVIDVPTVSGATYFVRRSVWDELTKCLLYQEVATNAVGAFLPTDHFYEETWCSYHARAHGHRVVYLGTVKMIHEWHKSSPVGSMKMKSAEDYFRVACANHGIELTF